MTLIYLDNNATTQPDKKMLKGGMRKIYRDYGNPSSSHFFGAKAEGIVDEARKKVARSLGVSESEIIFTSGGTEANSIATKAFDFDKKIISSIEHSSVYYAEDVDVVRVDCYGHINENALEFILKKSIGKRVLVSVMFANNETGTVLDPERKIVRLKSKYDFIYHVDAVQAYGKLPIDISGIDMLSISGHKVHALKGIGALYVSKDIHSKVSKPLFSGGGQEFGLRPGTENVLGAYSLGYIADVIANGKCEIEYVRKVRDFFESSLENISKVNGCKVHRAHNTSNLFFPDVVGNLDLFLELLSEKGVCVSGKSACSSGMPEPSRTIIGIYGPGDDRRDGSVRFSFSKYNTIRQVKKAIKIIKHSIECLEEYK